MFATIINDCRDDNASGRQATRVAALLGISANFIGVQGDLEATGNLVDALDTGEGSDGVVLVNVAPRSGEGKKWPNGTPFGYFKYQDTYVFSTIDGLTLSLVKKLGLTESVDIFDVPTVVKQLYEADVIDEDTAQYIIGSQFRSLDFLPRIAAFIKKGDVVETKPMSINEIPNAPKAIWWVDNFGNCKTTLLKNDVEISRQGTVATAFGELTFFDRLKDVPQGQAGIIQGSSGFPGKRFLEIVAQNVNGSAREMFGIKSGDSL